MERCPDCYGSAGLSNYGDGICSVCYGEGKNPGLLDQFNKSMTGADTDCWNCDGSGKCPTCDGTGKVDD